MSDVTVYFGRTFAKRMKKIFMFALRRAKLGTSKHGPVAAREEFFSARILLFIFLSFFSLSLLLSLSFVEVLYVCLSYFCISFSLFSIFLTIFNQ